MLWPIWVVLTAGSIGSALRAVRPPNHPITPDLRGDLIQGMPGRPTRRPQRNRASQRGRDGVGPASSAGATDPALGCVASFLGPVEYGMGRPGPALGAADSSAVLQLRDRAGRRASKASAGLSRPLEPYPRNPLQAG
jgi:hypothetical protein